MNQLAIPLIFCFEFLMLLRSIHAFGRVRSFGLYNRRPHFHSSVNQAPSETLTTEYLLTHSNADNIPEAARLLLTKRPNLELHILNPYASSVAVKEGAIVWSCHRGNLQLDSTNLEALYLGRHRLSEEETAQKWDAAISSRIQVFDEARFYATNKAAAVSVSAENEVEKDIVLPPSPLGDGGKLQSELDTAITAVQKAAYMSRSMQRFLLRGRGAQSKDDRSPVTIADFAVQALVIHILSKQFPSDAFIAEESSEVLRENEDIRMGVIDALNAATGTVWIDEQLYETVDKGQFDGQSNRIWVLDPVDGTKGFMRGEHYCIALALLVAGKPMISVLGCPNVALERVLQPDSRDKDVSVSKYIAHISEPVSIPPTSKRTEAGSEAGSEALVYPTSSGSVFFAVTGQGAYARSLAAQLGAAFEVQVSVCPDASDSALCEAVEESHGDRAVTKRVSDALKLRKDYVRLDGQCKTAIVGAGAAEGNMRLPPSGYREKIWDHAAGSHFIIEAGGEVTDLSGKRLDFSQGRFLAEDVTGIIASNGVLHEKFLEVVNAAKKAEEEEIASGRKQKRIFGQDSP